MTHRRRPFLHRAFLYSLVSIAALPAAAMAQESPFGEWVPPAVDEPAKAPWKEGAVAVPGYPNERDLMPVPLGPADTVQLFVDRRSVAVGADGVVRLTLVVESPSGARSVYYEGFRCEIREHKTYAVGSTARTLQPNARAAWRPIPNIVRNAFHRHLAQHYLCDRASTPRPAREIVRRLRDGIEPGS